MKPKPASIILLSLFLTVVAGTPAAGQQLAQNGGFETGDFSGWTQTGNSGYTTVDTSLLYAHSGTYGAKLGPWGSLGYISQSISTTPGQFYYLSLWLDSPDGETPNRFLVSWNGTNIFDQAGLAAIGWTNLQFTNLATTDSATLRFGFRNDQSYFGLDDITVFRLPPASGSSAAYTFSTLAGSPDITSADGLASEARFDGPDGIAVDAAGNLYAADTGNSTIRRITRPGKSSTIAGYPGIPGSADGVGSNARFSQPQGVAVDNAGNIYVTDFGNSTVRRMTVSGTNWVVSTIAGLAGNQGSADGAGTNAQFYSPYGVAVDSAANLYVADYQEYTIRKITLVGTNWVVSTIAGLAGHSGHTDGANSDARFSSPEYIAVDSNANLYVTDSDIYTIRKITPVGTNWVVTTFAGLAGNFGAADGTGTNAQFHFPDGIALDRAGNLYVSDSGNETVRKVTSAGVVTTLAGSSHSPGNYGSADGTGTNARFWSPRGLAVDLTDKIYVSDFGNNEIRKVTTAGVVSTVAGLVPGASQGSADGIGAGAQFSYPFGAAVDSSGTIYIADFYNDTIRQITSAGVVSTMAGLAGNQGTNDGAGSNARFYDPYAVAVDGAGNVYVADYESATIRLVTSAGSVSTIAGLGGNTGTNDGVGGNARFYGPEGIAVDGFNNVYVADTYNSTIRKIRPEGGGWIVSTIAGLAGSSGANDGANNGARFSQPAGIAVDLAGNLFVADSGNDTIRMITPVGTDWVVSTIAGLAGHFGSSDGTGTNARFGSPGGIAVDSADNLFVADTGNNTLRRIAAAGGGWVVSTIGGLAGNSGNSDGAGSVARFYGARGIAVDSADALYVADAYNNTIRKGVFSQFANISAVSLPQPPANGQIMVTLLPPEAGGQWRFPWELAWRNSGTPAANLVTGEYPIQFRDVPGYLIVPLPGPVAVPVNGGTIQVTNVYYATVNDTNANAGSGSLTVNIGPSPPPGAGWRFLGDSTPFLPPGYSTNIVANTYLIEFAPVSGFFTPPALSVQIAGGQPAALQITYQLAQAPPANVMLPAPVPPDNITNLTEYPFGFNGQLETDAGYGSGVAVETNVVLTAAHMIFNDQTLSYVSQAYWFFQEETGVFAPDPLPARGWYVLSGYASERTNDITGGLGADQSTPQSRNLDVAALYFQSPAANGGYGGYLLIRCRHPTSGCPAPVTSCWRATRWTARSLDSPTSSRAKCMRRGRSRIL